MPKPEVGVADVKAMRDPKKIQVMKTILAIALRRTVGEERLTRSTPLYIYCPSRVACSQWVLVLMLDKDSGCLRLDIDLVAHAAQRIGHEKCIQLS
jgi:hypothetical protein